MPHSTSNRPTAIRRAKTLCALTGSLLIAALSAAAIAQQQPVQPATDSDDSAVKLVASRFVTPETSSSYVEKIAATFSMANRMHDPFGQIQDPNAKPPPPPTKQAPRPTGVKQTPFAEIINKIRVTAVIPAENRFLIGSRVFRKGGRFPLKFGRRNIQVEVVEITSKNINFKNLDSGEVAELSIGMMPAGMQQGGEGFSAPGLEPENNNTPLELDSKSGF